MDRKIKEIIACSETIIKQTILFLVSLPLFPIFIIYFAIFALIRLVIWKYLQFFGENNLSIIKPLAGRDTIFLMSDVTALNKNPDCFITGTLILEGKVDVESFQNTIKDKLVLAKNVNGLLKYPELQQNQVKRLGYWWWAWDQNFKVENHVKIYEHSQRKFAEPELMKIIGKLSNQSIDFNKPLWEILIAPNFQTCDHDPKEGDATVIILRLSHSYWDGLSILKMLAMQLGNGDIEWIPKFTAPKVSIWNKFISYSYVLFQLPYKSWEQYSHQDKLHEPSSEPTCDQWIASCINPIPLQIVKKLRENHGISFQGLLLASISSGFSKFMERERKTKANQNQFHLQAPFPWPDHPNDKICNHWTGTFYKLPFMKTTKTDPSQILNYFDSISKSTCRSTALVINYHAANLCSLIPMNLVVPFTNLGGSTGTFSNMKGPPHELKICNYAITDLCFWLPVIKGQGISISVISYRDSFRIGVIAKEGIEKGIKSQLDLEKLCLDISESLEYYCKSD